MRNQENDPHLLRNHRENNPRHLSDEVNSTQSIQSEEENCTPSIQSQEQEPLFLQPNHHSVSAPPLSTSMISSPPSDSSVIVSRSHGYVFSQTEEELATYQSPPSDYYLTYVFSSPPSPPIAPPVQLAKAQDEQAVKSIDDGHTGGGINRRPRVSISDKNRDSLKRKALLGFRILGFLFCFISFSIMAADKNQGWALDCFYRFKEFRYCMSINVIGVVYLGLQSYDLACCLATGKIVAQNQLRLFLNFSLDQILAYLVLSASSTAAFRVEDWESN